VAHRPQTPLSSIRLHAPPSSLSRLLPELTVQLFFDPLFVVGRVRAGSLLKDETRQIGQLIDEVEELRDVVGDGRTVGIDALQMLLEDLADALHALGHRLEIRVRPRLRLLRRLHQQDRVGHF